LVTETQMPVSGKGEGEGEGEVAGGVAVLEVALAAHGTRSAGLSDRNLPQ